MRPAGADPGRIGRTRAAAVLAVLAMVLAGCNILFPGLAGPIGPGGSFDESFFLSMSGYPFESGDPSPIVTYRTGHATIKLADGTTVKLDLRPGSQLFSLMGSNARWSDATGWNLMVVGAGSSPDLGNQAFISLDLIRNNQHLTTEQADGCTVTIDVATATGLRGSATCKALTWTDAMDIYGPTSSAAAEPPFDAEITFSAAP